MRRLKAGSKARRVKNWTRWRWRRTFRCTRWHLDEPAYASMVIVTMAYAGLLLWAVSQALLPWWMLPVSFLLNLLTFWMYWADKRAAQAGQWRTPESTLQLLALA